MATKEQEKKVSKLIKKYKKEYKFQPAVKGEIKTGSIFSAVGLTLSVGADLLFTGGIGTIGTIAGGIIVGGLGGVITPLLAKSQHNAVEDYTNKSGQKINSSREIISLLESMESTLSKAFNIASENPTLEKKETFLKIYNELEEDIKALFPFFEIKNGGTQQLGTEKYIFSLSEEFTGPKKRKIITSMDALKMMEQNAVLPKKETSPKQKNGFGL